MDSILKLADQLGKAIADSAAAQDLQSTRQAMHTDPETSELLKKFVEQSNKLAKLSQEQSPSSRTISAPSIASRPTSPLRMLSRASQPPKSNTST